MSEHAPNYDHRAAVNRANAAHSTGPRTQDGKANSKRNSFKHGLYAKDLVLPGEDPAELDQLRVTLRREHQPANETESILVNEIAEHFWRLRRMREFEARGMQPENLDGWLESGLLALVARNMASAERGMHKAIAALRQLQKDRGFVPSKSAEPVAEHQPESENGFVPSNQDRECIFESFLETEPPASASDCRTQTHSSRHAIDWLTSSETFASPTTAESVE